MSIRWLVLILAGLCLAACGSDSDPDPQPLGTAGASGTGAADSPGNAGAAGETGEGGAAGAAELSVNQRCEKQDAALGVPRPEGWEVASHCKEADPDYGQVFDSEIPRLDLVVTAETYAEMEKDLEDLQGDPPDGAGGAPTVDPGPPLVGDCDGLKPEDTCTESITGAQGVCKDSFGFLLCYVPPPAELVEACAGKKEDEECSLGGEKGRCFTDGFVLACAFDSVPLPDQPCADKVEGDACNWGESTAGGLCTKSGKLLTCQGPLDHVEPPPTPLEAAAQFWPRDPKYFDATVSYQGKVWTHVGYRYKGNNGLAAAVGHKRPFRLELDEFEDAHPEITDQRLFGFKELSFSPGGGTDASYLRQVMTSEMFARAGVPTPRSALVNVYLDRGNGPEALGVYAMTEVPGDPMTQRCFGDKNGSLYKPDGLGAHLLEHHPESFHPKSAGCPADQSDIKLLIASLNANMKDRDAWRQALSRSLDLDGVITFFAANQANGNWDTYGGLAHNYYLYAKRSGGPLHFIPWDFDLSLLASSSSNFSLDAFPGEWPLLQAIARDAQLYESYHVKLAEITEREYDGALLQKRVTELSAQVRPLLAAEGASLSAFDDAVALLTESLSGARAGLHEYLDRRGF